MSETKITRRAFARVSAGAAALALAGGAAFALADAEGSEEGEADEAEPAGDDAPAEEGVVVDAKGREVAVPESIERIAVTCMGGGTQTVCTFGGADRLVVSPSMAKSAPLLLKIFPQIEDAVDAGTFDDVNIETIAAAEPDFCFVSSTSDKGNAAIEELGIPTYTLSTANATVESMRNDYINTSILLGTPELGEAYTAFWDEIMGAVDAAAKTVPEDGRLVVYRCGAEITAANHTPWAGTWIEAVGGVSAAENGTTGDVSVEQVAEWNPDVILTSGDIEALLADDRIQDIAAIKNGAVYAAPKGTMGWDAPSPEVPLGFAWLGAQLYPEAFSGIDVEAECVAFYKNFYGYDLTDEELDGIFKRA